MMIRALVDFAKHSRGGSDRLSLRFPRCSCSALPGEVLSRRSRHCPGGTRSLRDRVQQIKAQSKLGQTDTLPHPELGALLAPSLSRPSERSTSPTRCAPTMPDSPMRSPGQTEWMSQCSATVAHRPRGRHGGPVHDFAPGALNGRTGSPWPRAAEPSMSTWPTAGTSSR